MRRSSKLSVSRQDYWHVFVHYCSSDTWSGTRAADEETGGYTFHGRHVFEVGLIKL